MLKKFKKGEQLPAFSVKDIDGRLVTNESLKNKKTLIVFWRWTGCHFCATAMLPCTDYLQEIEDINVVYVYTSSKAACHKLQKTIPFPKHFHVISDEAQTLYALFGLNNRRILSMIKTIFSLGPFKQAKLKKKFIKEGYYVDVSQLNKGKPDGDILINPGDFLIDEAGTLVDVHYAKKWHEHFSIEELSAFIEGGKMRDDGKQKAA